MVASALPSAGQTRVLRSLPSARSHAETILLARTGRFFPTPIYYWGVSRRSRRVAGFEPRRAPYMLRQAQHERCVSGVSTQSHTFSSFLKPGTSALARPFAGVRRFLGEASPTRADDQTKREGTLGVPSPNSRLWVSSAGLSRQNGQIHRHAGLHGDLARLQDFLAVPVEGGVARRLDGRAVL